MKNADYKRSGLRIGIDTLIDLIGDIRSLDDPLAFIGDIAPISILGMPVVEIVAGDHVEVFESDTLYRPDRTITKYPQYMIPQFLMPYGYQDILAAKIRDGGISWGPEDHPKTLEVLKDMIDAGYIVERGEFLDLTPEGIGMATETLKAKNRLERKSDLTLTFDEFISSLLLSVDEGNFGEI